MRERPQALPRVDRTKVVAAILALFVVCSLAFAGVAPFLIDRGSDAGQSDDADQPAASGTGAFEATLRDRIAADPTDAKAMVSLANLLATTGKTAEAIDWYGKAVELDPHDASFRLDFALTLTEADHLADAEVQYRKAIAIDGGNADAHYSLAELYRIWQPPRTDEAIAEYRQAIAVAPGSVPATQAETELQRLGLAVGTPAGSPAPATGTPTPEAGS